MKPIFYNILIASIFLILSCDKKTVFVNDNYPKTIIPLISSETENDLKKSGDNKKKDDSEPVLKINIGNNYAVVYIKNINLDFDVEDEQVVVIDKNSFFITRKY